MRSPATEKKATGKAHQRDPVMDSVTAGGDAAETLVSLSEADLARIAADQRRVNAEQIALGAKENPLRSRAEKNSAKSRASNHTITIRSALQVGAVMPRTNWLLRPYVERDSIAVLYGDFGTFKSFVVIDWAMRIALGMPALGYQWPPNSTDVLLISAEGRALPQRLRGWCIRNFPGEDPVDVLGRAPVHCVDRPVNLSDSCCALALVEAINALGIVPGLIIIDTMTRNSDGRIENSTTDAGAYLTIIDQGLRARYGCAVLLTHHVGHAEKGRIRGPIVLAANTDALIRIERPDPEQRIATVTVDRLKDSDAPAPQGLRAELVELGEVDEDGEPMTTLALDVGEVIQSVKLQPIEAKGKAQRQLLAAIRAQNTPDRIWSTSDIREAARIAGMHRNSARKAVNWLVTTPLLKPTVGGWKLADA